MEIRLSSNLHVHFKPNEFRQSKVRKQFAVDIKSKNKFTLKVWNYKQRFEIETNHEFMTKVSLI